MRLFFGATLPDQTKNEIVSVQEILRPRLPNAKFEGSEKLHITLQFIGDFRQDFVDRLFASALEELRNCPDQSPATEVVAMNYFPNEKTKRGIWLDCQDDGSLAVFANALRTASAKFGIVPESRAFKPHITIARLRETFERRSVASGFRGSTRIAESRASEDLQKFVGEGKLSVERFFPRGIALFESTLKSSGSEYRILNEYLLE